MHTVKRLLERGDEVVGIDNVNNYYDVRLKYARLEQLKPYPNFTFIKMDIANRTAMENLFAEHKFPRVIHPPVLPQEEGLRFHHRQRDCLCHAPPQSPSQKMPRLQNPSRGLYETVTLMS